MIPADARADIGPRRAPQAVATALTVFTDSLLRVFAEAAPEAEPQATAAFRSTLKDVREQIGDATHSQQISAAAATGVAACEQYFQKSRRYLARREVEFLELIAILRDATKIMIGGSSDFNAQILSSSERFGTLVDLDDVRELKRRVSDEVTTLRHAAEVKQEADQRMAERLSKRVEVLQLSLIKVEREAACDPLTRVANRGSFDRTLPSMVAAARESGAALTLAIIDLDDFKNVNDTYGHLVGDRVLKCAADALVRGVRKTDFVARYGGEEFAVVLAGANLSQAINRFDALLKQIASRDYEYQTEPELKTLRFTASCGLAELTPEDAEASLIARADEALYDAKRKGKNRTAGKKRSRLGSLLGWT